MKFRFLFYLLIPLLVFSSCKSIKNSKEIRRGISLEVVQLYRKCINPLEVVDKTDETGLLGNFSDLSYSTTYTSIYTHDIKGDSLEKDSLRVLYAEKLQNFIKTTFPKIEITNDSILLRKNYWYMVRYSKAFILNNRFNKRIEKFTTKAFDSNKQLFIKVNSFLGKIKRPNHVGIYIFDIQKNELLYRDNFQYNCDIRDYESLEKVIFYGLLKLKENFE